MADVQLKNGYFSIANALQSALARTRIPGEARQIFDLIVRKTYGFHKKEDHIAITQFGNETGLKKVAVCKGIAKLVEMNLIVVTKKGNVTKFGNVYSVNKDFETWKPLPKKAALPKKVTSVTELGNEPLPKTRTTKDTNTKNTIKTSTNVDGAEAQAFGNADINLAFESWIRYNGPTRFTVKDRRAVWSGLKSKILADLMPDLDSLARLDAFFRVVGLMQSDKHTTAIPDPSTAFNKINYVLNWYKKTKGASSNGRSVKIR